METSSPSISVYSRATTMQPTGSLASARASFASLRTDNLALRGKRVQRAYDLAVELYKDRSFEVLEDMSLLDHVCGVVQLLVAFTADEDTVIACLLQHALYCSDASASRLEAEFGTDVRTLVHKTHLLSHVSGAQERRSLEEIKTIVLSLSDDVRAVLLRLCAQAYLMQSIAKMQSSLRLQLSRESLYIYAPIAARLGIYVLKYHLEDAAFPICYPTDSENIQQQLKALHLKHGIFLARVAETSQAFLRQEGMRAEVMTREKHPYSIFQKMQKKSVTDIQKVHDLIAMRVLVKTVPDCYQTLGLLHRLATPVTYRFKDYIAFPKPNQYQSLHTCLVGLPDAPEDVMMEVQIRTKDMHREAEYGVAAHWLYKELPTVKRPIRHRPGLKDVLGDSNDENDPSSLRLLDHIYVLTPRADIIELPEGSTPLDFAFALHTEIGLRFASAKVNSVIVPLAHKLENGDVVEILTHKHPRPSIQWLQRVSTSSARSSLKAYFAAHQRTQFVTKGREALNRELHSRGLPMLDAQLSLLRTFDDHPLSMHERENLLVKIGMGSVRTSSILRHVSLDVIPAKAMTVPKARVSRLRSIIQVVEGEGVDMPIQFAKCCNVDKASPRPGIIGCVTRRGEINVHRDGCRMLRNANPERKVRVKWR